ncbi:MAG: hypothetical protein ABI237_01335 [Ginsengibacter sp.]
MRIEDLSRIYYGKAPQLGIDLKKNKRVPDYLLLTDTPDNDQYELLDPVAIGSYNSVRYSNG